MRLGHINCLELCNKILFADKNSECLAVNILPQITGNRVSELPNFKNFVGKHTPGPPWRKRSLQTLLLVPVGAKKRETPTSNLTESTDKGNKFLSREQSRTQ